MIVFNLKQSGVMNYKVIVMDMFERMSVIIRSEDVSDIIRMGKKDCVEAVNPVIVECKSEYDKCAINETGLNGDEYVEFGNLYKLVGTNGG